MDYPLALTFGVEIEFVLHYRRRGHQKDYEDSSYRHLTLPKSDRFALVVRENMIDVFRRHGIRTNFMGGKSLSCWTVNWDPSVEYLHPIDYPGDDWCPIELQSPIYEFWESSMSRVREVINEVKFNFTISLNETCALQVHIGNGNLGFPIRTIKNFGILITVFERQLNSLHPLHRLQSKWTRPVSRAFPYMAPWDKIRAINACQTTEAIVELFHPSHPENDRWVAYNFLNLTFTRRTIEFRQHQGSLDRDGIINWAQLAGNLVQASHLCKELPALVQAHINDNDYTVIDLLLDLGIEEQAEYYARRGIYDHPRQPCEWIDPRNAGEDGVAEGSKQEQDGAASEFYIPGIDGRVEMTDYDCWYTYYPRRPIREPAEDSDEANPFAAILLEHPTPTTSPRIPGEPTIKLEPDEREPDDPTPALSAPIGRAIKVEEIDEDDVRMEDLPLYKDRLPTPYDPDDLVIKVEDHDGDTVKLEDIPWHVDFAPTPPTPMIR